MTKKLIRPALFVCSLLLCTGFFILPNLCISQESTDLETVLTKLEEKYAGQSFEARFKQITSMTALDIEDTATGNVWFSHPGKMRWQYLQPRHYEFITDAKTLWFYQPDAKQVSIRNAEKVFEDGVGSAFLSDFSSVRKNNTCTIEAVTEETIDIRLTPKKQNPSVKSILIQISRQTFIITHVTTWNQQNDTTKFEFTHIHFGSSHPAMFKFTPPEGTTLIQEDQL